MKLRIMILSLVLLVGGCSDFLEESSQDEIRPATIDDMIQLLNGEALPRANDYWWGDMTDIFTDDKACFGLDRFQTTRVQLEINRYKFGWQRGMFDANEGQNEVTYWEYPYKKIAGCNVVLEYLDRVSGGQKEKDNLRGEAYALRGYYYLMLVNFFGLPYNSGDPEKNPGVPLKLTMNVTEAYFPRNSVAEVYRRIEKDLLEADRLLKQNQLDRGLYHMNHLAAEALLSRMYLYMENWDKAIEYAGMVLEEKPQLLNFARLNNTWEVNGEEGVYNPNTPDEIIWMFVGSADALGNAYGRNVSAYCVSDDFLACFDEDYEANLIDLRRYLYVANVFDLGSYNMLPDLVVKDMNRSRSGIRTAELYLNIAEAYTRKFMAEGNPEFREKALEYLDFLRSHRYDINLKPYEPLDIKNGEELFELCKLERRRELCREGNHRWFDLRRHGMPALKHVWFLNPGEEQEYLLEENSPRYVLPIPSQVIEYNRELVQNPN